MIPNDLEQEVEDAMPFSRDDEWSRDMREVMAAFRRSAEEFSDNEIDAIVDEAVGAVRPLLWSGDSRP